jgi:hypothetical protein
LRPLHDAAIFLPFAETFFPGQPQRAELGGGDAANAAVGACALFDPVRRRAGHALSAMHGQIASGGLAKCRSLRKR